MITEELLKAIETHREKVGLQLTLFILVKYVEDNIGELHNPPDKDLERVWKNLA